LKMLGSDSNATASDEINLDVGSSPEQEIVFCSPEKAPEPKHNRRRRTKTIVVGTSF
jgi:hypothetical protein